MAFKRIVNWYLVVVVWLFLAVPWVCLQFVSVVFPDHTPLLFINHRDEQIKSRYQCVCRCTNLTKHTVKPVLSSHSKIDKTKILMNKGSLMKVESIAECSSWSIQQCF